jgi:YHS domain-containing protein
MSRESGFRVGLLALLTAVVAAAAAVPALALDPVNQDRKGLALHGYDPVAYFTDGKPVAGTSEHTFEWKGATWRFASAEHRERFAADPERYAPQYGGYCAKAVSENQTADVDPEAWKIVDGKLYLNYSPKVQALWEQDIPGRIARADANWPRLVGGE